MRDTTQRNGGMSQLELASADMRAGRFASALAHLRRLAVTGPGHDDPVRDAALAEALYLTGDSRQANTSATAALTRIMREGAVEGKTQEPPCGTNVVQTTF